MEVWGWWVATKGQITTKLSNFQGEQQSSAIFKVKWLIIRPPIALIMSQNIDKSMAYIMNESVDDF